METVKNILITTTLLCLIFISVFVGIYAAWDENNSQPSTSEETPQLGSSESSTNLIVTTGADVSFQLITTEQELQTIDKNSQLFGESKTWTPGRVEVIYLAVTNNDEALLSYSIGVQISDEKSSVNAAGEEFKLSDYLQFGFIDNLDGFFESSGDALSALTNSKAVNSGLSKVGAIEAGDSPYVTALVVYLPETATDAVAAEGQAAPEITLGLSVFVTSPFVSEDEGTAVTP